MALEEERIEQGKKTGFLLINPTTYNDNSNIKNQKQQPQSKKYQKLPLVALCSQPQN